MFLNFLSSFYGLFESKRGHHFDVIDFSRVCKTLLSGGATWRKIVDQKVEASNLFVTSSHDVCSYAIASAGDAKSTQHGYDAWDPKCVEHWCPDILKFFVDMQEPTAEYVLQVEGLSQSFEFVMDESKSAKYSTSTVKWMLPDGREAQLQIASVVLTIPLAYLVLSPPPVGQDLILYFPVMNGMAVGDMDLSSCKTWRLHDDLTFIVRVSTRDSTVVWIDNTNAKSGTSFAFEYVASIW